MRLLLVEDDALLGDALRAGLSQQGFQIDWVRDGMAAERELRATPYDAAILDLGLPRQDGLTALSAARRAGVHTPVLILTARDDVADRIHGLDLGADDYVVKPVDLHELAARLRALIRRAHGQTHDRLQVQQVTLDMTARTVLVDAQAVSLSTREFDLLHILMLNADRVMSRAQLEQRLYNWRDDVDSNAIEVHMHHLRRKLPGVLIDTVRGVGYRMPKATANSASATP